MSSCFTVKRLAHKWTNDEVQSKEADGNGRKQPIFGFRLKSIIIIIIICQPRCSSANHRRTVCSLRSRQRQNWAAYKCVHYMTQKLPFCRHSLHHREYKCTKTICSSGRPQLLQKDWEIASGRWQKYAYPRHNLILKWFWKRSDFGWETEGGGGIRS